MNLYISDPVGADFYRVKIGVNGSPYLADFSSVTDDVAFDGLTFDFPIFAPLIDADEYDPETAGLFTVGDTVVVEWQLLDREHYEFWNTLEFAQSNQGPFSSYSRAATNINGAIGVWGGSVRKLYEKIIK